VAFQSEEGKSSVIEMTLSPGVFDNEHSHHHETVYFIKGGKLRIHEDGKARQGNASGYF